MLVTRKLPAYIGDGDGVLHQEDIYIMTQQTTKTGDGSKRLKNLMSLMVLSKVGSMVNETYCSYMERSLTL